MKRSVSLGPVGTGNVTMPDSNLHTLIAQLNARPASWSPGVPWVSPETDAKTPRKGVGPAPYVVMVAGNAADFGTTIAALSSGRGREANPLLGQSPARIAAAKIAATTLVGLAMHHLAKKGHPTAAKLLGYLNGGAMAAVAAHNARVGR